MKIIIAGGRDFTDFTLLTNVCDYLFQNLNDITIISGMAIGADMLGYHYAKMRGFNISKKPAQWDNVRGKPKHEIRTNQYGNKYWALAGHKRNLEMANEGDILVAFWDKKSKGSRDMIHEASKRGLAVRIINY